MTDATEQVEVSSLHVDFISAENHYHDCAQWNEYIYFYGGKNIIWSELNLRHENFSSHKPGKGKKGPTLFNFFTT